MKAAPGACGSAWRYAPAFALAAALVFAGTAPRDAFAQAPPQMQIQVDADTVGVGDVLHLQLSATSDGEMPSDPQLGMVRGFRVRGQNASPTRTTMIVNGTRSDRYTLTVDWALQAVTVGSFAVGPPSVALRGQRFSGRAVTLHVVPRGQAPHSSPRQNSPSQLPFGFSFSPFDMWRGLMPEPGAGLPEAPSVEAQVDPKLALDAPRGAYFFLHATVDKPSVVVGEQVVFTVNEYIDTSTPDLEVDDDSIHDAQAADFVKRTLMRDDQEPPTLGFASVGGRTWMVKTVRRWALFPIHAGDLNIGAMSLGLVRPHSVAGQQRTTEAFVVHAVEPPMAGRPPSFETGNVGRFSLTAEVTPRRIEQGGAVGVHVELSGRGNVPSAVTPPAREGVEWLTPEVHEQLGALDPVTYGGKKTFDFVVRVKRAGDVDLGEMRLPFWDPELKKYQVARAEIGVVQASPSSSTPSPVSAASASPDGTTELLGGLPAMRDRLEGTSGAKRHPDDSPLFWFAGVAGAPFGVGLGFLGRAAGLRARQAWRARRISPAAELRTRVAAAREACEGQDSRAADAAIARAIEAASVVHAGVSIRGVLGGEVAHRLEQAGVKPSAAQGVAELLRQCELARFAPDAANVDATRERWARALAVIGQLEKGP